GVAGRALEAKGSPVFDDLHLVGGKSKGPDDFAAVLLADGGGGKHRRVWGTADIAPAAGHPVPAGYPLGAAHRVAAAGDDRFPGRKQRAGGVLGKGRGKVAA